MKQAELKERLFLLVMLMIVVLLSGYELKLLQTYLLIDKMVMEHIDYDAFRELQVSEAALVKAEKRITHIITVNPVWRNCKYIDDIGYITFSMIAKDYELVKNPLVEEQTFIRGIGKVAQTKTFQELYSYYEAIITDLEYFPVPRMETGDITYADTWSELRTYGGDRKHEGTDLMASNNQRGYHPIISITDGTVEKMGWLEQGGYRIGIRSESGAYFYYAHLYTYAPELNLGDDVIAGQLLGFMGDSGYGSEGTIGQFNVHLHLGVYVDSNNNELSVNPYWILQILEKNRTEYNK